MPATGQETGAPAMDRSLAAQGRRANNVVERKLDELCASLHSALSSPRSQSPDAERRLVAEIKTRTDFLRKLLVAESECHGGARPAYLAEAESRFAVLEATFDQWARGVVAAPATEVEEMEGPAGEEEEGGCSGSECSCTDSCQEATTMGDAEIDWNRVAVEAQMVVTLDATDKKSDEVAPDATATVVPREEATAGANAKNRDPEHQTAAETKTSTVQRRWWRRSAAWCGAAGVVAVVAVGLAVELAAGAHRNVNFYVVPT